jgi:hypothetical protein
VGNEGNLTPFKPGQSGNPQGRPPGSKNLSTILKELLEEEVDIDGEKLPFKTAIIKKLIFKAHRGNLRAIQEIFDRTEGKAKQEIKHEGIPDQKFSYVVVKPVDD